MVTIAYNADSSDQGSISALTGVKQGSEELRLKVQGQETLSRGDKGRGESLMHLACCDLSLP